MLLQQAVPSGTAIEAYAPDPGFWSLLVVNTVSVDGVTLPVSLPGLCFLAAGEYDVSGSVLGYGNPTMAVLALTTGGSSLNVTGIVLQSQSVLQGSPLFFGSVTIPTSLLGNGSLIGAWEYIGAYNAEIASSGLSEIYINLTFTTKTCPSSFAVQQTYPSGTAPPPLAAYPWHVMALNAEAGTTPGVYLLNSYSVFVPAGTYKVRGLVCGGASPAGSTQSVACLCLTSPAFSFSPNAILLQSQTSISDCVFCGDVTIPAGAGGGSILAVFAFADNATGFGQAVNAGLPELYVNITFTKKCLTAPAPLQCTVQATYPSGTTTPLLPTGFSFVPLNNAVGTLEAVIRPDGTFYLPSGKYRVEGVTAGSRLIPTHQAFLVWFTTSKSFNPFNVLLQSQNIVYGDLHFDGTINVPDAIESGSFVALYTYAAFPNGNSGTPVSSGLPEIYTSLVITQLPPPSSPCVPRC